MPGAQHTLAPSRGRTYPALAVITFARNSTWVVCCISQSKSSNPVLNSSAEQHSEVSFVMCVCLNQKFARQELASYISVLPLILYEHNTDIQFYDTASTLKSQSRRTNRLFSRLVQASRVRSIWTTTMRELCGPLPLRSPSLVSASLLGLGLVPISPFLFLFLILYNLIHLVYCCWYTGKPAYGGEMDYGSAHRSQTANHFIALLRLNAVFSLIMSDDINSSDDTTGPVKDWEHRTVL